MGADDRRSYFRVPARIAIRHRRASAEEIDTFERELLLSNREPTAEVDPAIQVLLDRLERKLDRILAHLEPDSMPPLGAQDVRSVEVSGSGVRYEWSETVAVGDRVIVEMLLPGTPVRRVRAVGEVVFREEPRDDRPGQVAVRFEAIDEGEREAIIRYTYDVQRAVLRNRALENHVR